MRRLRGVKMKTIIRYSIVVFAHDGSFRYVADEVTEGYFIFNTLAEAKKLLKEVRTVCDEPNAVILKETREVVKC